MEKPVTECHTQPCHKPQTYTKRTRRLTTQPKEKDSNAEQRHMLGSVAVIILVDKAPRPIRAARRW